MIEIFRWRKEGKEKEVKAKWRIKIINETLEFDTKVKFDKCIQQLTNLKEEFEPNK